MNPRDTRKRFLQAAAGGAWVALGGTLGCDRVPRARATAASAPAGQAWNFRSRPDLHPPVIEVITRGRGTAPGYLFIAPKNGPEEAGPGQDGFETVITVHTTEPYVGPNALNGSGRVLGTTSAFKLENRT